MQFDPLATLATIAPDLREQVRKNSELTYTDGALPRRIKLLVAMAFDAEHGAVRGVSSLARQAKEAGATNEEIAEVLRVTAHLTGVGCLYTASDAFKELE
jgi:alkylhydroperoxidase/carboxymuconolactone decarboxylase family protein YurZ